MTPICKPRLLRLLAVFLAVACLLPSTAMPAGQAAVSPAWTQRTLDNGLRVYAVRDTATPNVSVQVWYAVGGKDDPKGRQGFAHLFEHLIFKQTRNLPTGTFVGLAEDVGGTNDASTEDDYTRYFTTVPAAYLERILFAEADRMAGLVIDPADFRSERETVENEIRMRLGQPYGKVVQRYIPAVSYARLPYARSTLGSIEDLETATVEEARAFHAIYYRPDNAVLVVAGNYDVAALDRWIDRYFAPIPRPAAPIPRVEAAEPVRAAPARYVVHDEEAPSPAVVLSYPAPRLSDADTPALAVINAMLSAGGRSRLQRGLVDSGTPVAQASSSLLEQRQLGGSLAVYAILGGDTAVADGETALRAEVARLRDDVVPADELARVKKQLLTAAVRERGTPDGKAAQIARAALLEGDARAAERRLAGIEAVSAADVQRVARVWLADSRVAVIHYLPADGKAKAESIPVPSTVVERPLSPPPEVAIVTPAGEHDRVPLPGPGKAAAFALKPVEFRLQNGLRVVVIERRGTPLVTLKMVAPAGSTNEPAGRAGLAALAAALMTKGTHGRSAEAVAGEVEALGGSIASGAGGDGASIGVTVRAADAAAALAVLSDAVRNPRLDAAAIDNARGQAIDALDGAQQDAMKLARMVADRLAFGDAARGNPRIGTAKSLAAITAEDVAAMVARAWRPEAATFVVVGDITPASARVLAERAFGDWHAVAAPATLQRPAAAAPAPRVVAVDLPGAAEAAVVVTRAVPARTDRGYPALRVANAALGGGGSSRLNSEIRYKRALSYDAGSALIDGREAGALVAATLTKHEAAAQVVGLIVGEMRRLGTEAVPAAELAARRQLLAGNDGRAVETTEGIADVVGNSVLQSVSMKDLSRSAAAIAQVDAAAVRAAAKRWFDPAGASIVVVGDTKQFAEALRAT